MFTEHLHVKFQAHFFLKKNLQLKDILCNTMELHFSEKTAASTMLTVKWPIVFVTGFKKVFKICFLKLCIPLQAGSVWSVASRREGGGGGGAGVVVWWPEHSIVSRLFLLHSEVFLRPSRFSVTSSPTPPPSPWYYQNFITHDYLGVIQH